jgi:hypothetical protein
MFQDKAAVITVGMTRQMIYHNDFGWILNAEGI